jgi:transposase
MEMRATMNFTMNIPGLKDCMVTKVEERFREVLIYVEMERKYHRCPKCGQITNRVHDYRWQKIKHLKWFERSDLGQKFYWHISIKE